MELHYYTPACPQKGGGRGEVGKSPKGSSRRGTMGGMWLPRPIIVKKGMKNQCCQLAKCLIGNVEVAMLCYKQILKRKYYCGNMFDLPSWVNFEISWQHRRRGVLKRFMVSNIFR
jgi:hypothetical protein